MSHFPVLVCLPATEPDKVQEALERALAPFDENAETAPRREYLGDWQKDWESAIKYFGEHPDRKPAGLDELNTAAVLSAYEGETITEEYPEGSPVAMYYRMTTYNEQAKWDWWCVGGRFGRHFHVKDGEISNPALIRGERGFSSPPDNAESRHLVDGGPRGLLDFDAQLAAVTKRAGERHDSWTALVDGLPDALPWSHFVERVGADEKAYPIDRARHEYGSQPRVIKARASKEFMWADDVIGTFAVDRDAYAARVARDAVVGFALIDLDGRWISPGRMGWFGMSSDTEDDRTAYAERVLPYLDGLPADALVVIVDCHI